MQCNIKFNNKKIFFVIPYFSRSWMCNKQWFFYYTEIFLQDKNTVQLCANLDTNCV